MTDQETLSAPPSIHRVAVREVRHYTDRLFAFRCDRPPSFRFRSGEFVMIGLASGGKPLLRAYSIASPAWDETLEFYSIKVPDGPLTSKLQHIQPGDDIVLGRKATGTLVLDALKPGKRLFLLSTGTGIAPFASLIRDPDVYARFDEVILTHTCRTAPELRYGEEVVAGARNNALVGEEAARQLRHVTSLTRESHALEGRVTRLIESSALFDALKARPFDPASDRIMICGSTSMLSDTKALALALGFTEGSNHDPGEFVIERAFVER